MNTQFKDNPLVSVIINCFNGDKYLKRAIDILDQAGELNSVLVVFSSSPSNA